MTILFHLHLPLVLENFPFRWVHFKMQDKRMIKSNERDLYLFGFAASRRWQKWRYNERHNSMKGLIIVCLTIHSFLFIRMLFFQPRQNILELLLNNSFWLFRFTMYPVLPLRERNNFMVKLKTYNWITFTDFRHTSFSGSQSLVYSCTILKSSQISASIFVYNIFLKMKSVVTSRPRTAGLYQVTKTTILNQTNQPTNKKPWFRCPLPMNPIDLPKTNSPFSAPISTNSSASSLKW